VELWKHRQLASTEKGSAEKEGTADSQESWRALQDKQARSLGSWAVVAVGWGVIREAELPTAAAEVVAVAVAPPATFPTSSQGAVGRVSPPIEE
jgi:hypothetical protein